MLKNLIVKSDGTEIDSSLILSCTLTQTLNSGQEFTIGSACTDEIEVEYLAQDDNLIAKGDVLTLHWVNDSGTKTKVGIYYCEKPNYQGLMREISGTSAVYKVVAYDTMSKLDADFSGWLRANQAQFPKTIWQLVQLACQRAGVTLAGSGLPINGSYSVQAFYADDLTCRQIISWAAEAAGCYAHMNANGKLEFSTYTDYAAQGIGPGNPSQQWTALNFAGQLFAVADGSIWTFAQPQIAYYADSLSYEDYTVKAIEKVQIRQSDNDVGVIYPDSTTATNTYVIQGNLLLTTGTEANLKGVAQNLYNALKSVTYTPCKVSVPSSSGLACGQIVHVTDAHGREFSTCLMSATISAGKASFESTGSASRESSSAVNSQSYKNLTGKMLEIKTSVDGLNIKASELSGQYTQLSQTVDSISLTAENGGNTSKLTLSANGIALSSADITFSGMVTFTDLSTWNQDKTIINGGNITTGQIHNLNYSTVYDLDGAWIRMGTEAGERVFLDNRHIAWYATINTGSIGLTGVLYSEAGSSYIGACSKYAKYGWVDGLNPTSYVGLQITYNRSDDSDADFNTTRVGVSGTLNCQNLSAWGSKSRVVSTSFGALKMAAFETPVPTFADWGRAECNADGWCVIVPDPRYAETIAQHGQLTWLLTDCDGTGHLWAQDCGQYAIVHGAAGQRFAWLCMAAQRGYEGEYAERSDSNYPAGTPAGVELAASTAARALDAGANAADDLLTMDTGAKQAIDTLLDDLEGNAT